MNEPNQNQNTPNQTQALTRFRALNFVEDLQRTGGVLAEALRQASLQPWPDENGDYYAVRTLEDWWYAYKEGGFNALVAAPRSDQGKSRVLEAADRRLGAGTGDSKSHRSAEGSLHSLAAEPAPVALH